MRITEFFGESCRDSNVFEPSDVFTEVLVPEQCEDGSISMVTKVLEAVVDPFATLKFSDFSITEMLRAGVSPKSIYLSFDKRIGSDKEIKAFNDRVDSLAESLFNN